LRTKRLGSAVVLSHCVAAAVRAGDPGGVE
jgi:hypothetical protein